MFVENFEQKKNECPLETLSSFISKDIDYTISYEARFIGFKHRMKVEFLKSFIV